MDRRDFLKGTLAVSGLALLGGVGVAEAAAPQPAETASEVPPLPWGYEELDPEYVRKLAHLGYYAFACCGGAFWAIMTALKEKKGYPYTLLPLPSVEEVKQAVAEKKKLMVPMLFGEGGVGGFASLCGAPNGACAAINMALEREATLEISRRLLRWYERTPFPSDISNDYAVNHEFFVPSYKSDKPLPQSVANSVLCHVSVSRWCVNSGYASGSKERSERCGRLTGDVAAMAVIMMNAYAKGALDAVEAIALSQSTAECRTCHEKGTDFEEGHFTRGYMECASCHDDNRPHLGENVLPTAFGVDVETWAGAAVIGTVAGIGSHVVATRIRHNGHGAEAAAGEKASERKEEAS
jgi:hypothetical protein